MKQIMKNQSTMRTHRNFRCIKLIGSIIFFTVLYILISAIQDPSDFNKVIHHIRVNLTGSTNLLNDDHYGKLLLPTLEVDYQQNVVQRRKNNFISSSSSFKITNSKFWSYFPSWSSWCPYQIERIGGILWNLKWRGEGGKWLCGLNLYETYPNHSCIAYSYGIEDDTSFEIALLERTNCSIYMFDPTIDGSKYSVQSLLKKYPGRTKFTHTGLSSSDFNTTDAKDRKNLSFKSLASDMSSNHHDFIDILKVDIEGGEFSTFENIIQSFNVALPFGQLQVEIHLPSIHHVENLDLWTKFQDWYEGLELAGLRPFHSEPNPITGTGPNDHVKYYEYSFINIKSNHFILKNYTLPS